jgi:two-component system sensor histidine kinase YesM
MKLFFFNTLTGKIMTYFFLLIVLPVIGMGLLVYQQLNESTVQKVLDERREILAQVKNNLDTYLQYMERISEAAYFDKGVNDYLKLDLDVKSSEWIRVSWLLDDFFEKSNQFTEKISQIYIIRNDNRYIVQKTGGLRIADIPKERERWTKLSGGKKAFKVIDLIGANRIYGNSRKAVPVISLAREIVEYGTNAHLGLIVIDIDFQVLKQLFENSKLKIGETTFIIGSNSHMVSALTDNHVKIDSKQVGALLKTKLLFSKLKIGSENYYAVKEALVDRKYYLIAAFRERDIQVRFRYRFFYLFFSFGMITLFSLAISFLLSESLSHPVKRLIRSMKQVEAGGFDQKCEAGGTQEMVELANGYNLMIDKIRGLFKTVSAKEREKKEIEINALQAQINPHFIYNTLATIKWMAIIQNNQSITNLLNAFINLMEYSANFKESLIPIEQERLFLQNYLLIQKTRYHNLTEINITIPAELLSFKLLKFIVQPVLENALFHGIGNLQGEGSVRVTARRDADTLFIMVKDNGAGITVEKLSELRTSIKTNSNRGLNNIGLSNIQERIRANYGPEYGLEINSIPAQGTEVLIKLPLLP